MFLVGFKLCMCSDDFAEADTPFIDHGRFTGGSGGDLEKEKEELDPMDMS